MKNSLFLPLVLAFSVLMLSSASLAANGVTMSVDKSTMAITAGGSDSVTLTIANNQDASDVFSVSLFPSSWSGLNIIQPTSLLLVSPHSTATTQIFFSVPNCTAGSLIGFTVSATSVNNKSISSTQNFNLQVVGYSVCINSMKADKFELNPGDTATITTGVENLVPSAITDSVLTVAISKDGSLVKSIDNTIFLPSMSGREYAVNYTFDRHAAPGTYDVDMVLKNGGRIIDSKSTSLKVNEVKNVVTSEAESNYVVLKRTMTTITNDGNIASDSFFYNKSVPSYLSVFFEPATGPSSTSYISGNTVYSWQVPQLKPGEDFLVSYRINFVNPWTIAIVAAIALYVIYLNFYSLAAVKSYYLKGPLAKDKEVAVSVEVKNRGYREVRDIVVRDKVPAVAKLEERFETLRPLTRKLTDGTELTWRMDAIKPRETRVLTYRIKPVMEILGTLNLPEVKVSFVGAGGRKTTKFSNMVEVR